MDRHNVDNHHIVMKEQDMDAWHYMARFNGYLSILLGVYVTVVMGTISHW